MRSVFTGMVARLADQNIEDAVKMFSVSMRPKFEQFFTSLRNDLPSITDQLGRINAVNLMGQVGDVTVLRTVGGRTQAFSVPMVRGDDGIWRMEDM